MMYWHFNKIDHIEERTFHKVLEKFYDYKIDGLVRENIQNSLDARRKDSEEPVIVRINTGQIDRSNIPGIEEVVSRIKILQPGNEYAIDTVKTMHTHMNNKRVDYISFEDENTNGLFGAHLDQSKEQNNTWSVYAYNKGVHLVDSDEKFEKIRGGSHGIGKIASNAASDIFMMFFANCDRDGRRHLGGTVQLMDHLYQRQGYRATGYFTGIEDKTYKPFENDFGELFKKETRGLKIIIPFLREQFRDSDEIIKSICDNFMVAILKGTLVVYVNGIMMDKLSVQKYITSPDNYEQEADQIKKDFTPLYLKTLRDGDRLDLKVKTSFREYRFKLFFTYNPDIVKGRLGIIRTVGMKIEDHRVINNATKPFNAILMPATETEDALLKSLENESHTQLSVDHIKDKDSYRNANQFLRRLSKEMATIIEDYMRKANPVDGKLNTQDVLYEVQNKFRDDLEKATSKLKVKVGSGKRTVVKVEGGKGKSKSGGKGERKGNGTRPKKNRDNYYSIRPSLIKRTSKDASERLHINLSNEEHLMRTKSCHLYVAIVDGMGKEYTDEFNLLDHVTEIRDKTSNRPMTFMVNKIENVPINDGKVDLQLALRNDYSQSLKFAYYLEV